MGVACESHDGQGRCPTAAGDGHGVADVGALDRPVVDRQDHLSRPRADGLAIVVEQEVEVLGGGDEGGLVVGVGLVDAVDGQLLTCHRKRLDNLVVGDVAACLHPRLDRLQVAVVNPAGVHLYQVRQPGPLREPIRCRQAVHDQGCPG